jgi:alkylation response protein AidB-like acyl-CoA dehydrogenase
MAYAAPVKEHLFLLNEVLNLENYSNLPGFADASPELTGQLLEEAARFCQEVLEPLNAVGDREGCRHDPATAAVTTPTGFKDAYRSMVEAGWSALSVDPQWGGQGLPMVLNVAFNEMASSANMAFAMYPGLTHGAFSAILSAGDDAQKALYLEKMATCHWSGAMNLTEPQCGTDLGLIRSKAVKNADGSYAITGEKIWISGGEQDLAPNIIHLVLARTEGAPEGTRGLSLFIVPKFIPDASGDPGERNGFKCAGLEEKMGIHGNSTCFMSYDGAKGWLLGEEHKGLRQMFVMMNEARLGVAIQGLAQAEAAYQAAAGFARERLQGRGLTGPQNPSGPADPIIVHPDVRRMLMDARAVIEGGRALLFWTILQQDMERGGPDEAARQKAEDLVGLMTPVLKSYLTDRGFLICSDAMQVHGGSGYTVHFPAAQYLRDSRIAMIYEGTNGVQALDLVGRKLPANGGRALLAFMAELDAFAAEPADETLAPFIAGLKAVKDQLQEASLWLLQNGPANPDNAAAASHDYLGILALTGLAFMWARMAKTAQARIAAGSSDPLYANKLITGRYFLERILPEASAHLAKLKTGAGPVMALSAEDF